MGRKTYRDSNGYLRFIDSGNLVHRWAAAKKLGRRLRPGEVVHHSNRIKMDNRMRNLRVFSSQKQHRAHHIKKAWERTTRPKSRRRR
ncbi:MAG: HNH endonuclease [Candidatus Thorarchaeota archaeon]|nr:HNH endonuclease [Candidatus Thorarchaeota archaeon]